MCLWTTVSSNPSLAQQVLQYWLPTLSLALFIFCFWGFALLLISFVHIFRMNTVFLLPVCQLFMEGRVSFLPMDFSCHHPPTVPEISADRMAPCVSFSTTIQQETSSVIVSFCHSTYYWLERLQEKFRWLDILIYELLSQSGINPFWLMETNLLKSTSEVFNHRQCVLQSWGIWKCEECGFSCHNDWWYSAIECLGTKMVPILQSRLWLCIMKSCSVENAVIALLKNMTLWKKGEFVRNQVKWGDLSLFSLYTKSH